MDKATFQRSLRIALLNELRRHKVVILPPHAELLLAEDLTKAVYAELVKITREPEPAPEPLFTPIKRIRVTKRPRRADHA